MNLVRTVTKLPFKDPFRSGRVIVLDSQWENSDKTLSL